MDIKAPRATSKSIYLHHGLFNGHYLTLLVTPDSAFHICCAACPLPTASPVKTPTPLKPSRLASATLRAVLRASSYHVWLWACPILQSRYGEPATSSQCFTQPELDSFRCTCTANDTIISPLSDQLFARLRSPAKIQGPWSRVAPNVRASQLRRWSLRTEGTCLVH
jgi:hypothetical protein